MFPNKKKNKKNEGKKCERKGENTHIVRETTQIYCILYKYKNVKCVFGDRKTKK